MNLTISSINESLKSYQTLQEYVDNFKENVTIKSILYQESDLSNVDAEIMDKC